MDEWEFHRTLDVNLGGPFFTMQQIGRVMRQQGGAIVNMISTIEQERTHKGHAAHLASQAGLIGLTCSAAGEFSQYNIRVNAVCHGSIGLDMMIPQSLDKGAFQKWRESIPNVRLGDHPDLVSLVLFLCSQAASSLTGRVFSVASE
jgi:3-oxoacyl-[acyl-carrier protein] reductase